MQVSKGMRQQDECRGKKNEKEKVYLKVKIKRKIKHGKNAEEGRLAFSSCQISAGGVMVSCDETAELCTADPLVSFAGTVATFSKGIRCHSS